MISGYYTALSAPCSLTKAMNTCAFGVNCRCTAVTRTLLKPGARCGDVATELNDIYRSHGLLGYRSFGYGHSFGVLSHYYGREAGVELREDINTVLQPGMVVSMEPMVTLPEGMAGAGGYREHDILVIGENGSENITKFPFGPDTHRRP